MNVSKDLWTNNQDINDKVLKLKGKSNTVAKDWIGNTQSVMATLNASNHTDKERAERDYYATPPEAVRMLLELETFNTRIWEPACGEGHISEVLKECGYHVMDSDIVVRSYPCEQMDFLAISSDDFYWDGDIITNPPFKYSTEFAEKALSLIEYENRVALFLRIQFLESIKRRKLFHYSPPEFVYVASKNLRCARNGDFENATGNASTYAWFIWRKGFRGDPGLRWFNPNSISDLL